MGIYRLGMRVGVKKKKPISHYLSVMTFFDLERSEGILNSDVMQRWER